MYRVFRTENSNGYWKYLLIQIFLIVLDCFSKWMDFRWLELRLRRMDNSWGWFLEDFYPPALKSFLKFSMLTWNSLCIKWEWKFRSLVVESCTPKGGEVVKLWKFARGWDRFFLPSARDHCFSVSVLSCKKEEFIFENEYLKNCIFTI